MMIALRQATDCNGLRVLPPPVPDDAIFAMARAAIESVNKSRVVSDLPKWVLWYPEYGSQMRGDKVVTLAHGEVREVVVPSRLDRMYGVPYELRLVDASHG